MNKIDDGLFNRISKHIIIICVSCVLLALLLIYEMLKVSSLNGRLEKYQQRYIVYAQAADMFENGSGILTNQARYFAETGDEEYLEGYFLELDADKHREKALALIEDIDDELDIYSYLEAAKLASDDLMDMEYHAMVLAASGYGYDFEKLPKQLMYYDISSYENGLDAEGKKALSIADRAYVLETGNIVLEGDAKELMNNDAIKKAYLGE